MAALRGDLPAIATAAAHADGGVVLAALNVVPAGKGNVGRGGIDATVAGGDAGSGLTHGPGAADVVAVPTDAQFVDENGGRGAVGEEVQFGAAVHDHGSAAGPSGHVGRIVFDGVPVRVVVLPRSTGAALVGDADRSAVPVHAGAGVGSVIPAGPISTRGIGRGFVPHIGRAEVSLDPVAANGTPVRVAVNGIVLNAARDLTVHGTLLDVRQNEYGPVRPEVLVVVGNVADESTLKDARRENLLSVLVVVAGHDQLFNVVRTLRAGGGLAHLLNGGKEQADQDRDDGDDDEQFDEREAEARTASERHGTPGGRKDTG